MNESSVIVFFERAIIATQKFGKKSPKALKLKIINNLMTLGNYDATDTDNLPKITELIVESLCAYIACVKAENPAGYEVHLAEALTYTKEWQNSDEMLALHMDLSSNDFPLLFLLILKLSDESSTASLLKYFVALIDTVNTIHESDPSINNQFYFENIVSNLNGNYEYFQSISINNSGTSDESSVTH